MNSPDHNCGDCVHAMDGADNVLRCRIHHNGMKCSPEAFATCKRFEKEIGSDSEESSRVWFAGAWCSEQGRGD